MHFSGRTGEVMAGNAVGRARSELWVGEIQVEHKQFGRRTREVMVGNEVGRARSTVRVGVQDSHMR